MVDEMRTGTGLFTTGSLWTQCKRTSETGEESFHSFVKSKKIKNKNKNILTKNII